MKRRIIATKIRITRQGEIKFFQVKIPFDALSIMGIETAMRVRAMAASPVPNITLPQMPDLPGSGDMQPFFAVPDPIGVSGNVLAGEIKLQSSDDCNVFYATDVFDRSAEDKTDKVPSVNFIKEKVWTHGCKRELEEVQVDGNTTVIAGLYKDRLGEMLKQNVTYDVFLYVWYKFKKEKQ